MTKGMAKYAEGLPLTRKKSFGSNRASALPKGKSERRVIGGEGEFSLEKRSKGKKSLDGSADTRTSNFGDSRKKRKKVSHSPFLMGGGSRN